MVINSNDDMTVGHISPAYIHTKSISLMPYEVDGHNVYKCYYCGKIVYHFSRAWQLYLQHLRVAHQNAKLWRWTLADERRLPVRE